MNTLNFTGRLAATPTLSGRGEKQVAKLTLIRNDVIGKTESGEKIERQTAIQFTAFNGLGKLLAETTAKGDQLIVTARVANNNYKKEGEDVYSFDFIIEGFDYGAPGKESRERLANRS
jgi:single-strand DNA-binding protein